MTYETLMVHLRCGQSNRALLNVAAQFVDRFDAHVIGIAACQPPMVVSADGTVCGDVFANDQRQMTAELDAARAECRQALQALCPSLEWRSEITIAAPAMYLSVHARGADLILTGSLPADTFDFSRDANPGSVVMEAGRPIFVVPANARPMRFEGALVAWNDTRECRRAAADALPLLAECQRVTVLEIARLDDLDAARTRVDDVVAWLQRHGVKANARVLRAEGNSGRQLQAEAERANADVIVAGAYGHSRLREWLTGGVTRDFLLESSRGVLVSH